MSRKFQVLLAGFLSLAAASRELRAQPAGFEILSVDANGRPSDGHSTAPAVSRDGKRVVFASEAIRLVPNDGNKVSDVFLRERDAARSTTTRISVGSRPLPGEGAGPSDQPAISLDGTAAAFRSLSVFDLRDTNRLADVYLHEIGPGTTELISIGLRGAPADGESGLPAVGGKAGNLVVFLSRAKNLADVAGNGKTQVYLRDRAAGRTELISLNLKSAPGDDDCLTAAISEDGRFVAFSSLAADLVADDKNGLCDVFVRDRATEQTDIVSVGPDRRQANGLSEFSSISPDGRFVAFASQASNLLAEDRDRRWDVFVRDRKSGKLALASRVAGGASDGDSVAPSLGLGGRFVVFHSSGQLTPEDRNKFADVFLYDQATGETILISRNRGGAAGGDSEFPRISEDGSFLVFQSRAEDIAPDGNDRSDIFGVQPDRPQAPPRALLHPNLLFALSPAALIQFRLDGVPTGRRIVQLGPLSAATIDNAGILWLVSEAGEVRQFDAGELVETAPPFKLAGRPAPGEAAAANGFLWIATVEPPRLTRVDQTGRASFLELPGLTPAAVALDPFGNVWIAAGDGKTGVLVQASGELRRRRAFRTPVVFSRLAIDHQGHLIGLSPEGVAKLSPAGALLYSTALPGGLALAVDGLGRAAVLLRDATVWLDRTGARIFNAPHGPLQAARAGGLVVDGLNRTWVSVEGAALLRRVDLSLPNPQRVLDLPLGAVLPNALSLVDPPGDRSGFTAANVTDQQGDADGDRLKNRIELTSGSDPLDDGSPPLARRVPPVEGLTARADGPNHVVLTWTNPVRYSEIRVLRDGREIRGSPFPGTTTRVEDSPPGGLHRYAVIGLAEGGIGGEVAGGAPGGGAIESSPETITPVVVGDGSAQLCVDVPDQPYALAFIPGGGGRIVVSSTEDPLPVFDLALAPLDVGFPHPSPGAEIRGIEYDAGAPGGRLLFLLADGRVFQAAPDGLSPAVQLFTVSGGPPASPTGYTGLSHRQDTLYVLLGPDYDCLVGFQAGNGVFSSESSVGTILNLDVEQSLGLHVNGNQLLVGIGEDGSQEITDAFGLSFQGAGLSDAHVNLPLTGLPDTIISDLEFVSGQGLYVIDVNHRRLCLLEAVLDGSPVIESIVPASGPPAGGTTVTLTAVDLRSQLDTRVEVDGVEVLVDTFVDGPDPTRKVLTFTTPAHELGPVKVEVLTSDGRGYQDPGFTYGDAPGNLFLRGDADASGELDITDAQFLFNSLFMGGADPTCADAGDANDDEAIDITDPTYVLGFLFLGGPPPPPPFPAPGTDPAGDTLDC